MSASFEKIGMLNTENCNLILVNLTSALNILGKKINKILKYSLVRGKKGGTLLFKPHFICRICKTVCSAFNL